uniref:T9SS type B sorting domain-containing protein n=1 Tax=Crocinitomix catalasitica TaxID=184607 RepID=UPI00048874E9
LEFVELGYEPAYCRLYDYQKGNGVVKAAMIGGVADYGYLWTNLQTGETSTNSTWGGLNPGEYQMVATDANGCTLTETITVDSLNPRANFEITSDQFTSNYKGTAEIDAHFVNLSENFANPFNPLADTTFFWNFDSPQGGWVLSEALEENFDTVYQARGESYDIDVCLVAINKNGCTDTLCKNIVIYEPIEFKHVNIFSPNGDGMNDIFTFQFQSKSISEFHCVIVDRWGITKTELDQITEGWDGTDKSGSKCTDGVYFYTYEAITDDGTELVGQGTVQIVGSK